MMNNWPVKSVQLERVVAPDCFWDWDAYLKFSKEQIREGKQVALTKEFSEDLPNFDPESFCKVLGANEWGYDYTMDCFVFEDAAGVQSLNNSTERER